MNELSEYRHQQFQFPLLTVPVFMPQHIRLPGHVPGKRSVLLPDLAEFAQNGEVKYSDHGLNFICLL